MKYDKFIFSKAEALENNRLFIKQALGALYSTFIEDQGAAAERGEAIRAINRLAVKLGHNDLVRND